MGQQLLSRCSILIDRVPGVKVFQPRPIPTFNHGPGQVRCMKRCSAALARPLARPICNFPLCFIDK
jgi:hypothetical protein